MRLQPHGERWNDRGSGSRGQGIANALRNTFQVELMIFDRRQNSPGIWMLHFFVVSEGIAMNICEIDKTNFEWEANSIANWSRDLECCRMK